MKFAIRIDNRNGRKAEGKMLSVKLEKFEGPLDLLLHLIEKNKVSIYDIPIAGITAQYLEYINGMEKKDLDLVSDFLVMAATLLDIKSKMLLPVEVDEKGEEIDPREELVERLIEYKLYKSLAKELGTYQTKADKQMFREPSIPKEIKNYEEPVDVEKLLNGVTLAKLQDIFHMVMKRQVDKIDPVRSRFGTIKKEPVRLADKLNDIMTYARTHRTFSFSGLLLQTKSRFELVVTFLACLELIKVGHLSVNQDAAFGEIDFEWNENCETEITSEEIEGYD